MEIHIQNGDKGISYAIKRQLQSENIDISKINSCWTQIMNAFKGDNESKVNGQKVSEQWDSLYAKVKCSVNDVITIANTTWENIKNIVKKSLGYEVQPQQRINDEGETEQLDNNGRVIKRIPNGFGAIKEYTYEGFSTTPSTEIQTEVITGENNYKNNTQKEYTYKYGNPPRITKESSHNIDNDSEWLIEQAFEYDEKGTLLSSRQISKCLRDDIYQEAPFTLISDYTYDSKGNIIKEIRRNSEDNSVKETIEWTYNEQNQKIHEKKTDGNGIITSDIDITTDNTPFRSPLTNSRRRTFGLESESQVTQQPQTPEVRQVECTKTEEQKQQYMRIFEKAQKTVLDNARLLNLSEKEIELIKNIQIESISYGPSRYDLENKNIMFNINDFRTPDVNNFIILILHEAHHGKIDNYTRENAEQQEIDAETRGIDGALTLYKTGIIPNFEVWGAKEDHKKISEFDDDGITTWKFVNKWFDEQYQHITHK